MAHVLCIDGPAATTVLDVEPETNGMPNLIYVPVLRLDEATETVTWEPERYGLSWVRRPKKFEPVIYYHLPPSYRR